MIHEHSKKVYVVLGQTYWTQLIFMRVQTVTHNLPTYTNIFEYHTPLMYSAIGFLIAACVLVAAIDQTSIREPKHLHNCPVSTLQNDFSSRCETKYPLEHFNNDFLVINNQSSSKLKEIVASSKFEYNTCFATFFSVREGQLTAFESKPVNLTCARLCPVTNDILHTFRNKR